MNTMDSTKPVAVLTFRGKHKIATVVTDGLHHATYELGERSWHPTLSRAISYLETRGYSIEVDIFTNT